MPSSLTHQVMRVGFWKRRLKVERMLDRKPLNDLLFKGTHSCETRRGIANLTQSVGQFTVCRPEQFWIRRFQAVVFCGSGLL